MSKVSTEIEDLKRLTGTHYKMMVVFIIAFFFEVADLNSFAYAAPALMKFWHITVQQVAVATSFVFIGSFLGALAGWFADLWGRRMTFLLSALGFSVFSFLNAFAAEHEPNLGCSIFDWVFPCWFDCYRPHIH